MSIPSLNKKPKYPLEFWVDIAIFDSIVKYFKEPNAFLCCKKSLSHLEVNTADE